MIGQLIIEGLAIGACYGLFGIAVVIIYKTSEVVNFAQGEMAMMSTFVAYHILTYYHYPFWAAYLLTMVFAVLLGIAIEFIFPPAGQEPEPPGPDRHYPGGGDAAHGAGQLEMGRGAEGVHASFFHPEYPRTDQGIDCQRMVHRRLRRGGYPDDLSLPVFKYTKLGVAMRATQQNQHAAKIMGVRVERVFSLAWGFSSFIGATAAMFFAGRATLDPAYMMEPFMRAFAAAVLGGLISIPGIVIGGELLGLIENFFGYVWPEWKPIVAFVVIVLGLVLCVRPSGLFAKHYVKKV